MLVDLLAGTAYNPAAMASPVPTILVFDSGLGGLTVFSEVLKARPDARFVYAADDAAFPYGRLSENALVARVLEVMERLIAIHEPKLVVIACNTASTLVLPRLRERFAIPFIGTVPAIKPAAALTQSGTIGLLGTAATIRQKYVDDLEREFARGKRLIRHACPELVAAAEAKLRGERIDPAVFGAAAAGLRGQSGGDAIDTVVLACTHFPLVEDELRAAMGDNVRFVDGAEGIARRIAYLTQGQAFLRTSPDVAVVTGDVALMAPLAAALKTYGLERFEPL
jgi:glutamate racemase